MKIFVPSRRRLLTILAAFIGFGAATWVFKFLKRVDNSTIGEGGGMILNRYPLDFQWPVQEPFLFCVHHYDMYPKGTESFGPERRHLQGRDIGMDFEGKDGFRMYHGQEIPGFPVHPHRGFETITIVRKGYVDHADSLGAAGRYGEGDVQWMTAGAGVQHSEMFPLLKKEEDNTLELFQIWLNLPRRSKMVPAHFKMFWSEEIPRVDVASENASVSVIAGEWNGRKSLAPPPDSWAADPENEVMILLMKIESGGRVCLPRARGPVNRMLYFFEGQELDLNGEKVSGRTGIHVDGGKDLEVASSRGPVEVLLLQAKAIGEPVFQHGPFVMNNREEIVRTFEEYQRTQFGGWPWSRQDMVHGSKIERFAKYPDGRVDSPKKV